MAVSLKPVNQQVIVITGASSGIGLCTARMAAGRGARIVLAARNADALARLAQEINAAGGEAVDVAADVGNEADVRRVAETAVARFGHFDTWVNNAGAGIYGRVEEVNLEDSRRLFETNFWGQVHGSVEAARHLRLRGRRGGDGNGSGYGGAIINVGSTESDRALPLHGMYSASKHAVKAFTDALRMELEEEGAAVSVTLIKPGSINTPFTEHAKNYMGKEPNYPPPVYAPEVVARAILHAAAHPVRDLFAGGGGKMISSMGQRAPRLTDRMMERTMFRQQQQDAPARGGDALHAPGGGLRERGDYPGHVMESSLYTQATAHPLLTGAAVLGAVGLAVGLLAAQGDGAER